MKKFLLGFGTCWIVWKYSPSITAALETAIAKLELQRDILKHDNPELRDIPKSKGRQYANSSAGTVETFVVPTRHDAESVLAALKTIVDMVGFASVSNLYDLIDIQSRFVDTKWGWTDLDEARIIPVHKGFRVELPRPEPIPPKN